MRLTPEVPDTGGMICGFVLRRDQPAEAVAWSVVSANSSSDDPLWLHFNLADVRARNWITVCEGLPEAARELLLDVDHHIRFERIENGLAGVVGDLHHDFDATPETLGVLRLYVDDRWVITARRHALKAVDALRLAVRNGLPVDSPIDLVIQFLDQSVDMFEKLIAELGEDVDDIEDELFKGTFRDESRELGKVRRFLARLRRHIGTQRDAQLKVPLPSWMDESESIRLGRAIEQLNVAAQDLELVQARARLVQEEFAGAIGEATNRNLYFLSIVTAVFLPITLIAGVFGMNVGGIPWSASSFGFWWALGAMGVMFGISFVILRWKRML